MDEQKKGEDVRQGRQTKQRSNLEANPRQASAGGQPMEGQLGCAVRLSPGACTGVH